MSTNALRGALAAIAIDRDHPLPPGIRKRRPRCHCPCTKGRRRGADRAAPFRKAYQSVTEEQERIIGSFSRSG